MKTINSQDLADFFKNYPLYSKLKLFPKGIDVDDLSIFEYFESKAYKFYCPIENENHTFKIRKKFGEQYLLKENNIPEFYINKKGKFDLTFHLISNCQSCDFKMDFLINIFSEATIDPEGEMPDLFIRKTGQFPAVERLPEKEVLDYLSEEDKENYKKALSNLSVSFGIGAFAYFRRIIENEIKHIVKDLSELEFEDSDKIKSAWNEYEKSHQMSNLIDNINPFIPKSLKEIGDNPIKLLYSQLSGGIHEFSEESCLEKAKLVDTLLRYVIKKVNSEMYELKEVRKAIKGLR